MIEIKLLIVHANNCLCVSHESLYIRNVRNTVLRARVELHNFQNVRDTVISTFMALLIYLGSAFLYKLGTKMGTPSFCKHYSILSNHSFCTSFNRCSNFRYADKSTIFGVFT